MAEPMIAPAAAPAMTPAATPQPRQCASTGYGNAATTKAAAASAIVEAFMGVLSGQIDWARSCNRQGYPDLTRLRADEARAAPADDIAVAVAHWAARPIAAGAARRIGLVIAVVHDIAGRRRVGRLAVGDGAADDGAGNETAGNAETDAATATSCVGSGRHGDRAGGDGRGRGESEDSLFHKYPPGPSMPGGTSLGQPKPVPDLVKDAGLMCRKFVGAGRASPPEKARLSRGKAGPLQFKLRVDISVAHAHAVPAPAIGRPDAFMGPAASRAVIGGAGAIISWPVIGTARGRADDGAGSKPANDSGGKSAAAGFGRLWGGNGCKSKCRG